MGRANTTRATRTREGLCSVCLSRRASAGHATCRGCRARTNEYSAQRYAERRAAGRCVRCGLDATGYLCELHAEERRARRQSRA